MKIVPFTNGCNEYFYENNNQMASAARRMLNCENIETKSCRCFICPYYPPKKSPLFYFLRFINRMLSKLLSVLRTRQ